MSHIIDNRQLDNESTITRQTAIPALDSKEVDKDSEEQIVFSPTLWQDLIGEALRTHGVTELPED